jgi:hypothetical protein
MQAVDVNPQIKAFVGSYSIPSAFSMVVPLKKMLTSSDPRDKAAVSKILKASVLLSETFSRGGPFENGEMSR